MGVRRGRVVYRSMGATGATMTDSAAGFINEADVLANDYAFMPSPNTKVEIFLTNSSSSVIRLAKRWDHSRIYIKYDPSLMEPL